MITNTITLKNDTHGTFEVTSAHLAMTYQAHSGWTRDQVIDKIDNLTGNLGMGYGDLNYPAAMIVLSYLTGGDANAASFL